MTEVGTGRDAHAGRTDAKVEILMYTRSSENLEMKAFEKFENAVFFKIFKIPSDRQLILV